VGRFILQHGCVQILPYQTIKFVTLKKSFIVAVEVSKIKVYFILCYWACVLFATYMIIGLVFCLPPI
jgi:hypothetical protein